MPVTTAPGASNAELFEEMFQYETISYVAQLELLDREGEVAIFKRQQRIRFLQSGVSVFLDRVWGDGIAFRDYWTDGLEIIEVIRTPTGRVVVLRLPRAYSKGETFDVRTERRILGGFTRPIEYWELTMFAPTGWLSLDISGRAAKRVMRPILSAPRGDDLNIESSRELLNLVVRKPRSHVPYRVEWAW